VIESGDEVVGTVMDVTEQWKARDELEKKRFREIKQRTEALRRSEAYWRKHRNDPHRQLGVRVPPMENAQGEAVKGMKVLQVRLDAPTGQKRCTGLGLDPDSTPPILHGVVRGLPETRVIHTLVEQAIRDRMPLRSNIGFFCQTGAKYIHVVGTPGVNAS